MNKLINLFFSCLIFLPNLVLGYQTIHDDDGDFLGNPAHPKYGCDAPITLKETAIFSNWNVEIGKLQLRYSSACEGVWVKVINGDKNSITISLLNERGELIGGNHVFGEYGSIVWSSFSKVKAGGKISGQAKIEGSSIADGFVYTSIESKIPNLQSFSMTRGSYAVNSNSPNRYSNVFMFEYDSSDIDQQWEWVGTLIRRKGTNYCLNTPSRHNYGNVFMWECNPNDKDQQWQLEWGSGGYFNVALGNTGYCLNANSPHRYSNVNIWKCNPNDEDQRFLIK